MSRQRLLQLAKVAATAGLAVALVVNVDILAVLASIRDLDSTILLLVVTAMICQVPVLAMRWRAVIYCIDARITFLRALRLTWIGLFLNQVLPSAMGGDVVRAWMFQRGGAGWPAAIASLLLDRVMALITLMPLIAVGLAGRKSQSEEVHFLLAGLVAAVVIAALAIVLAGRPISAILRRRRPLTFLSDAALGFRQAFISPHHAVRVFCTAIPVHLMSVTVVYALGQGVGANLSFAEAMIWVPTVMLIASLPISFAGWGLREGAMIVTLHHADVASAEALAISICFGIVGLFVSLPGGVVWLAKGRQTAHDPGT